MLTASLPARVQTKLWLERKGFFFIPFVILSFLLLLLFLSSFVTFVFIVKILKKHLEKTENNVVSVDERLPTGDYGHVLFCFLWF